MPSFQHLQYLVNDKLEKQAVIIPMKEWQKIVEDLEMLNDIKAYEKVKASPNDIVPFDKKDYS